MNFQIKNGNVKWIKLPDGRVVPERAEGTGENEFPGKLLGTDPQRRKLLTCGAIGDPGWLKSKRTISTKGLTFNIHEAFQMQHSGIRWVKKPDGTMKIEEK